MRERFAPSPTGFLHLGHAFSALTAWQSAVEADGEFILRIEDIDHFRCNQRFEAAIFEDLAWLGLNWPAPVMRQSERFDIYSDMLSRLIGHGLCFPCRCTRKDISAALEAPQEIDHVAGKDVESADGTPPAPGHAGAMSLPPVYPGTCRNRSMHELDGGDAIRLDIRKAVEFVGGSAAVGELGFVELGSGTPIQVPMTAEFLIGSLGDVVLARKDIGTSYHLAVVTDDAMQSVTHVTRGADIAYCTPLHALLQKILGFPTPVYRHHRLIRDKLGARLAKRADAVSIRSLRQSGHSARDIRSMVGLATTT